MHFLVSFFKNVKADNSVPPSKQTSNKQTWLWFPDIFHLIRLPTRFFFCCSQLNAHKL